MLFVEVRGAGLYKCRLFCDGVVMRALLTYVYPSEEQRHIRYPWGCCLDRVAGERLGVAVE